MIRRLFRKKEDKSKGLQNSNKEENIVDDLFLDREEVKRRFGIEDDKDNYYNNDSINREPHHDNELKMSSLTFDEKRAEDLYELVRVQSNKILNAIDKVDDKLGVYLLAELVFHNKLVKAILVSIARDHQLTLVEKDRAINRYENLPFLQPKSGDHKVSFIEFSVKMDQIEQELYSQSLSSEVENKDKKMKTKVKV